jgi:hypothetical protein
VTCDVWRVTCDVTCNVLRMYYAKSGFTLPTETATTVVPSNAQRASASVVKLSPTLLLLLMLLLLLQHWFELLVLLPLFFSPTHFFCPKCTSRAALVLRHVSRDLSHAASLQAPSAGLSTQTIAIIAGCSCGGVLLIAAAAYMIRRRRLALQPSTAPSPASAPAMEMAPVHQLPVEAWKQQQQQQQQQQQHDRVSHVPHVLQQA